MYTAIMTHQEEAIGKIEYLNRGNVVDSTEYTDPEMFVNDILDEMEWGVDIRVTLYKNENGYVTDSNELIALEGLHVEDQQMMIAVGNENECVVYACA